MHWRSPCLHCWGSTKCPSADSGASGLHKKAGWRPNQGFCWDMRVGVSVPQHIFAKEGEKWKKGEEFEQHKTWARKSRIRLSVSQDEETVLRKQYVIVSISVRDKRMKKEKGFTKAKPLLKKRKHNRERQNNLWNTLTYLHKRKTKDGVLSCSQKLKVFVFFWRAIPQGSHKQQ